MTSLAAEIEKDALNESISVSALLRKSLAAAKRLQDTEFEEWVSKELKGYPDVKSLPDYRVISGRIVVDNPLRGWIPPGTSHLDPQLVRNLSTFRFRHPVTDIEAYARGEVGTKATEYIIIFYDKETTQRLMAGMYPQNTPAIQFNRSQFRRILETIRTKILEWAVEFQRQNASAELAPVEEKEAPPQKKKVRNFIRENKHWIFDGLGTQVVSWIAGGLFLITAFVAGIYWSKGTVEPKQSNVAVTPTATPTPISTPTPTATPTVSPSPSPTKQRNRK